VSRPPDSEPRLVTGSALLQELHDGVPPGQFTLQWLVSRLHKQSFPAIIFLLAIVAVIPGVSLIAGLLLLVPTVQMIAGQLAPTFPRRIATRPLSTDKLNACLRRIIPILKVVEVAIHPRWPRAVTVPKRIVGLVILLLAVRLLVVPIPLSNMLPAALISLIALSYLEEDGLMLVLALVIAVAVLALDAKIVQDAMRSLMKISYGVSPPSLLGRAGGVIE
jgi:hypothetical protein